MVMFPVNFLDYFPLRFGVAQSEDRGRGGRGRMLLEGIGEGSEVRVYPVLLRPGKVGQIDAGIHAYTHFLKVLATC